MKKLLTVLLVMIISSSFTNAQLDIPKNFLGGSFIMNASFLSQKYKGNSGSVKMGDQIQITIQPMYGKFLNPNLVLGGSINYTYSAFSGGMFEDRKDMSFAFAPFIRMYVGSHSARPFVQGEVGFGKSEFSDVDFNLFMYSFSLGIAVPVNQYINFDFAARYSVEQLRLDGSDPDDGVLELGGLSFGVGATFFW